MHPLSFWQSPLLAFPTVVHAFSQRTGGVSETPFTSLNLGLHVGDNTDAVIENRRRTVEALGFSLADLVCAEQVHGTNVAVVDASDRGKGSQSQMDALPTTDALVTATPGVLLGLYFADCLPVFLVAPERGVVAVAHAGWRGLVGGVIENTIAMMVQQFDCSGDDLLAAVGPGISLAYFEVGPEVAAHFPDEVCRMGPDRQKYYVDLQGAARQRLLASGIPREHIDVTTECTHQEADIYFSHRREGGKTGRMGGFIGLRPE